MSQYVFLYKDTSEGYVAYIDLDDLRRHHICCDGRYNIHNSNFTQSFKDDAIANYNNLVTILSEEELNDLCYDNEEAMPGIITKLDSKSNTTLFLGVTMEEREVLKASWDLNDDDVDRIFDEYPLDYKDRDIVGNIYVSPYALGDEYASQTLYIDKEMSWLRDYIDFNGIGEDLCQEEMFIKLSDGRCIIYNM